MLENQTDRSLLQIVRRFNSPGPEGRYGASTEEGGEMTWERFERFALRGPDREWVARLFWPWFIAEMAYLVMAPIREWYLGRPEPITKLNIFR